MARHKADAVSSLLNFEDDRRYNCVAESAAFRKGHGELAVKSGSNRGLRGQKIESKGMSTQATIS